MKSISVVAIPRRRACAKTLDEIQYLGRSATQLARISATRMSRAAVADRLSKFVQLAEIENAMAVGSSFRAIKASFIRWVAP